MKLYTAETLTPVVLELDGKSPCVVDSSAKIKLAAKRIAFGKFLKRKRSELGIPNDALVLLNLGRLGTILQNPDWCRTAGMQSAQIASGFDKSHFAEKIEDVYEAVIQ